MNDEDVLAPYLGGAALETLGPDAETRLRAQLAEIQVGIQLMLRQVDELRKLVKQTNQLAGKLGDDAEAAARECFEVYEEDEFLYGYLAGIGTGWTRTARLLALLGNVLLVKAQLLEAEEGGS